MEYIGYITSILIGISLGLIGGGGSVLTLPVLTYLFLVKEEMATGYSLFIVGFTSLVGSVKYFQNNLVDKKMAVIFGIPSILAVSLTRKYLMPWIPDPVFNVGGLEISKGMFIMMLFAVLMILASYSMIRKSTTPEENSNTDQGINYPLIGLEGAVVGTFTGLVGAGGGFLIIPALVMLGKLPMKMAVGTSLVIIAAKSLIGFIPELSKPIDWTLLLGVTFFAVVGIFIGEFLSKKIDGNKLKPAFGYFILVMGLYILYEKLS
ncbi:MAG: sulfite exporter TauE/SafE family protein [Chitinophagales bacterium]|jgi:hypothetical protein|nr:sulfite exporter TauE/SafE family protein [Chitinophagales bacterium]